MTSCTSTPGTRIATSTLITSSSRGGEARSGGVRSQPASSCSPVGGDPEALLRAVVAGVVGLDQPVALQPLQRRVHLADVQRPDLAGPRLELLAQLKPVLGPLAEQRQQGVTDAHDLSPVSTMLSSILSMLSPSRYISKKVWGRSGRAPDAQHLYRSRPASYRAAPAGEQADLLPPGVVSRQAPPRPAQPAGPAPRQRPRLTGTALQSGSGWTCPRLTAEADGRCSAWRRPAGPAPARRVRAIRDARGRRSVVRQRPSPATSTRPTLFPASP